jgi:site-specific recombinase XerD
VIADIQLIMDNQAAVDGFIKDQQRRGLRPRTIEALEQRLAGFQAVVTGDLAELGREDLERWLDLYGSASTRQSYRSTLVVFWRWMVARDLVTRNIAELTVKPRVPVRLPRPVKTKELAATLACATPVERVMLMLGCYAGLRTIEIAGLRVEDVDLDTGWLLVADGKGGKQRSIPIHTELEGAFRALPLPRTGFVLRLNDGRGMSRNNVGQRIAVAFERASVVATPHRLRHWFGTEIAEKDLRVARELLGHESFRTTVGYAAYRNDRSLGIIHALAIAA